MMKKTYQLTNQSGTIGIDLTVNESGQIRVDELVERAIAQDRSHACELLGISECEIRYGFARVNDPFEKFFGRDF